MYHRRAVMTGALGDPVDWRALFLPSTPLLETFVRGSCVYLGLFILMRFVFRREAGAARISMLLLVVLLADAVQNAMTDDYTSVTDGLLLVATIMAWDYTLDWVASRVPHFCRTIAGHRGVSSMRTAVC